MKRLFLKLYGMLMCSLLLALLALNALNNRYYEHEIKDEYLKQTSMLAQAIQREVAAGGEEDEVLDWWRSQLRDNEMTLDMVARPPAQIATQTAYVQEIAVSEAQDQLVIMVPFDARRALRFSIDDQVEPGAMLAYYAGYAFLYLLLAGLVYALSYRLYRHIELVRQQAHRVAQGDYSAPPAAPGHSAFSELHADLGRLTESLQLKTRENELLTAAIHHELRTPLTRLRLALDMAQFSAQPEQVPPLMLEMDDALNDLSQLMDDILTLSRLRLAQQTAPRSAVQLDALILRCADKLDDPRLALELTPCQLQANQPLLERAISNLLENACKYGNMQIVVKLRRDGRTIALSVEDDGPGIPEDQRELVRQPFYRLDQHRHRSAGGVGLGLAITDMALKESGATWQIAGSPLGGTAMLVHWPAGENPGGDTR